MLPAIIFIVAPVLTGIFLLFKIEFRRGDWIQVVHVDEGGNRISTGKRFTVPTPERVARNGLSRVDEYVTRLVNSRTNHSYLHIFTPDGQRGLGLSRRDGKMSLGLMVDWRKEGERETAIRAFFAIRRRLYSG